MFSGIVEGVARLQSISEKQGHLEWEIHLPAGAAKGLEIGASVALNGVCLTATGIKADIVTFDLITETLERSSLGALVEGSSLNYERSMKFGDEVGGHLVSGHIMATGTVEEIVFVNSPDTVSKTAVSIIKPHPSVSEYIFEKGYIAIDGISLTVGKINPNGSFYLHIIPETLRRTTLGSKTKGDLVNIEIDAITQATVDTVRRMLKEDRLR